MSATKGWLLNLCLTAAVLCGSGCSPEDKPRETEEARLKVTTTKPAQTVSSQLITCLSAAPEKEHEASGQPAALSLADEKIIADPQPVVTSQQQALESATLMLQKFVPGKELPEPTRIVETSDEYIITYPPLLPPEQIGTNKCTEVRVYKMNPRVGVKLDAEK